MLKQLRGQFEIKSQRLRADFIELQRQEKELKMVSNFMMKELQFWKHGFEKKISLQKINLIQTYQTHIKL